jgi:hypothetical protein
VVGLDAAACTVLTLQTDIARCGGRQVRLVEVAALVELAAERGGDEGCMSLARYPLSVLYLSSRYRSPTVLHGTVRHLEKHGRNQTLVLGQRGDVRLALWVQQAMLSNISPVRRATQYSTQRRCTPTLEEHASPEYSLAVLGEQS